jgi:ABC-type amino acid transport substrate-binding protein
VPTHEKLGIAFAKDNVALRAAVEGALTAVRGNGEFARLAARWLPAQP